MPLITGGRGSLLISSRGGMNSGTYSTVTLENRLKEPFDLATLK